MRLFAAIDIPDEIQRSLGAVLNRLRPAGKLSWTTVDRLHITTKFIGEWPENRLEEMKSALVAVCAPVEIEIAIRGLGWFPNPKNPRVFWAGVEGGAALTALAGSTDEVVHRIGVPREERAYSPHLTLARIRERVPLEGLRKIVDNLESTDFGVFKTSLFYLYLSHAGRYTKLAEFGFA
jgi:RNA 2',3'-cyclic 3'-phosphodiesterase